MGKKRGLVCGVGINDYEGSCRENSKVIKSYNIWTAMLNRCYGEKKLIKNPTYISCSVCDEWSYYSNFKAWFDENYKEGYQLDKDILVEGNKIYRPDACVFIPQYLNTLLTDHRNARGDLPLGVTKHGSNYKAQCANGQGKQLNKTFKTIEEAQQWYSITKSKVVKDQVDRALADNVIELDIYEALIRRKF